MDTRITTRRFDLSDKLRSHIENNVSKLNRYFDNIQDIHFVLEDYESRVDGKTAEVTLSLPGGILRAEHASSTHREAVSECVRQLRRQVIKHKDRLASVDQDRHR